VKRLCILTSFVALLATPLFIIGGEPRFPRDRPIRIIHTGSLSEKDTPNEELYVLDGDLMFLSTFENGKSPGGAGDPPLPQRSLQFLREGQMLRAIIKPIGFGVEKGDVSRKLLAKDRWYVTAEFSTEPPRVMLTEKPTKGSRWARVSADFPGRYLIKSEDAQGKAVWLTMEKEGKTYRGGIARRPILSEEKHRFSFVDAESGK
jgi:hypothetical protein